MTIFIINIVDERFVVGSFDVEKAEANDVPFR